MQLELKRIQHELGTTFVYVTHDQEEALAMSDRIAVMNARPRRADRRPARDLRASATAFVADFIGSLNALELTVDEVVGGLRASCGSARRERVVVPVDHDARRRRLAPSCGPARARADRARRDAGAGRTARGSRGRSPRSCTSACTRSSTSTPERAGSSATASPTSGRAVRAGPARRAVLGARAHRRARRSRSAAESLGAPSRRSATRRPTSAATTTDERDRDHDDGDRDHLRSWFGKRSAE